MRDIKFRVFDMGRKQMYFPFEDNDYLLLLGDSGYIEIQYHANFDIKKDKYKNLSVTDNVENELTLLQFTGIKDKNGKEIYEGDIVLVNEEGEESIHEVIYGIEYNYPAFDLKPSLDVESNELQHCVLSSGVTIEVIGNIFENPELLK